MAPYKLTPDQERFLAHSPDRSARLLAGPGAGKSSTCVAYLARHANSDDLNAPRMRMLTFTRAATAEFAGKMRETELQADIPPPSTIHSFALRILKQLQWPGVPQPVRLSDSWETKHLIYPQLSRLLKSQGHMTATPGTVERLEREMAAGFESLNHETFVFDANPALGQAYLGIWGQHRSRLAYLLLSELPYRAGQALEDMGVPDMSLDLLLVDEYQDLNNADIKLLKLLADAGMAVVAIGDEDQSIYGFRKAAPEGIRNFLADFNATDDYQLRLSLRCGREIVGAAQKLIDAATGRPAQPPMETPPLQRPGVCKYLRFSNENEESACIAALVKKRIDQGVPPRDIAILVRSRMTTWVRALKPSFDAHGIDIASDEWVNEALADMGLRRLRSCAALALNEHDSLSWMTLMKLANGISDATADTIYRATGPTEMFGQALVRICENGLDSLAPSKLARLRALVASASERIASLRPPMEGEELPENWGLWLSERSGERLSDSALRLLSLVGEKVQGSTPTMSLAGFLGQLEPLGKDYALEEQNAVRFMSMQKSKGLTVNTCIVLGVEEGQIPMPPPKFDPEEERRLLYVAMTRATDFSILTFSQVRSGTLAFSGTPNAGPRRRSPLLENVLSPLPGRPFVDSL